MIVRLTQVFSDTVGPAGVCPLEGREPGRSADSVPSACWSVSPTRRNPIANTASVHYIIDVMRS